MTPEMQLAKMLGSETTEQEKLASAFDSMSIEELEDFLRNEKTAAKKDEKMVDPGWMDAQGGMYRAMRASDKGVGQVLADPELIGNRVTKGLTHGVAGMGIGAAGGALVGAALKNPKAGALVGGGLGSAIGHTVGATRADIQHLKKKGIQPKLLGLGGARFSPEAAQKYLAKGGGKEKKSSVLPSHKWADAVGREMAKQASMSKEALPLGSLLQKGVGQAAGKILSTGAGTRAAVGAGVGALGGALKNPGVDPATGQQKSRLGNMLVGAGIGAGVGAGAAKGVKALGGMNNAVGRYVGGATKQVAKQTGNIGAYRAAQSMQLNRIGGQSAARTQRLAAKAAPGASAAKAAPAAAGPTVGQRIGGMVDKGVQGATNAFNKAKQVAKTPVNFQSPIRLGA